MEEKTMTILDVLQDAVKTLSGICLPVQYVDPVGTELSRVMKNLHACIESIKQHEESEEENDRAVDPE